MDVGNEEMRVCGWKRWKRAFSTFVVIYDNMEIKRRIEVSDGQ